MVDGETIKSMTRRPASLEQLQHSRWRSRVFLSSQGETKARALNVSTGQATEPVADWGLAQLQQERSGIDTARERRRAGGCGAALLLLTDAGGATGDEGRQAWLQLHPARASGGEIVGDGGGETRKKSAEMRRGKWTRAREDQSST
jgi:hypothetical protein